MTEYIIKYRNCKIDKVVSKSGKTKLTYGIVYQEFKSEEEANAHLDDFLAVAIDINNKES